MSFIVSDWFKTRPRGFEVEGIKFDLMALTENLSDDVQLCNTYEEMLSLAADSGISVGGVRVIEDDHFSEYVDEFWSLGNLDVDCDPCIKYRVGEKVCEISGLSSVLKEMLEKEKAKADKVLNGDGDMPLNVDMGTVEEEYNAHNNINQ